MLPDDDKQYAIETCRSSESVLKKWFKNKLHTISAFVGFVIIIESLWVVLKWAQIQICTSTQPLSRGWHISPVLKSVYIILEITELKSLSVVSYNV